MFRRRQFQILRLLPRLVFPAMSFFSCEEKILLIVCDNVVASM